jgi:ribosomal peptide maturation radical SAM protein 1
VSEQAVLRICLVAPPLTEPSVPNLAVELLAAQARADGHQVRAVHAALRQRRTFRRALIHGLPAPSAFAPTYFGLEPGAFADLTAAAAMADFAESEQLEPEFGGHLADDLLFAMNDAQRCVDDVCNDVASAEHDLIGFSIGFDSQKLPAAAIARGLRARGQRGLFVAGGTGCDGPMGQALLQWCPDFDLVVQGEAERSWPLLLRRVSRSPGTGFRDVPGVVWRDGDTYVSTPEVPFDRTFLAAPEPDYTEFLAQRAESAYATSRSFILFESSRGCWWGERRQCTFCGIRNVSGPYRVRDAEPTVDLIERLQARYRPDVLYSTDSIADRDFDDSVWPELARRRQEGADWSLFYETKSDLTRARMARLAAAGVKHIQPGIESLSSPVLRLMRKGATALQQVTMLKWAHTYRLDLHYSLMTGLPGETSAHIDAMIDLIDAIPHLPPPAGLNRLALHRFSPHFDNPATFGLSDVRPFETQRVMYRCDDELLLRLCYQLDYDVPVTPDLVAARRRLKAAVHRWQERHALGASMTFAVLDRARIVRSTGDGEQRVEIVHDPVEVHVFDVCQEATRLDRLARTAPYAEEAIAAAVQRLQRSGMLLVDGAVAVVAALPQHAEAYADAGFSHSRTIELALAPVGTGAWS